jgi:hypothetical protein
MLLCAGSEVLTAVAMKTSIFRDVSGEHVAFIFRVEEEAKQEISVKQVASRATSVDSNQIIGVIIKKIERFMFHWF